MFVLKCAFSLNKLTKIYFVWYNIMKYTLSKSNILTLFLNWFRKQITTEAIKPQRLNLVNNMRIAICDDESIQRKTISEYIMSYGRIHSIKFYVEEFSCGEELVDAYEKDVRFDMVILDAQMKELDGVQTGARIRELDKNVIMLFATAFSHYVQGAFRLNASQYLNKPIKEELFHEEMDRAIEILNKKQFKYKISTKGQTVVVEVKDLYFIETNNRQLKAVTAKGNFLFSGKIKDEENKLAGYDFIRCHQGFLVNMAHINEIKSTCFTLQNGFIIPISKHLVKEVKAQFNRFLSGCKI